MTGANIFPCNDFLVLRVMFFPSSDSLNSSRAYGRAGGAFQGFVRVLWLCCCEGSSCHPYRSVPQFGVHVDNGNPDTERVNLVKLLRTVLVYQENFA